MIDPLNVPALTAGFPRNIGRNLDNWQPGITVREVAEFSDLNLMRLPLIGRKAVADIRAHIASMTPVQQPVATSMTFRACNQRDLAILELAVKIVPQEQRPQLAASIIEHDLMRGPWWFQLLVGLIRLRGRVNDRLLLLYRRNPALADELIEQTRHHILHGKDTEDADSKGGFSQREVNILVAELQKILL